MACEHPSHSATRLCSANMLRAAVGAWCRHEPVPWHAMDEPQWQDLAEHARAEGLSGLLYTLLPDCAPTAVREALRTDYRARTAVNMLYMQKLKQLAQALQSAEVRFVVVKGAALLATVYPDLGVRSMEDIDLLVYSEDANIFKPVMAHLGWQQEDEDIAGKGFGERYRAELAFSRTEGGLLLRVEAHLDVPGFYTASRQDIWNRVTFVSGADIDQLPVLTVPAHLSYLCAHYYYHHCGCGTKWLADVALLASQVSSWHDVVVDAYHFGTTRPLHLALHEVAKHLKVQIPQHIVDTLRFLPMPVSLRLLFELCKRSRLHYIGVRLLDLYRAPNWHTRIGYLWRKLTAPRWRRPTT